MWYIVPMPKDPCHGYKMDFKKQTRWKWGHHEKQSKVGCLRILIDTGNWLWRDIYTYSQIRINYDTFGNNILLKDKALPNGC